jgi:hypothetical protein
MNRGATARKILIVMVELIIRTLLIRRTREEYTRPLHYRTYSGIRRKLFRYDAYEAIRSNLLTSIVTRTNS